VTDIATNDGLSIVPVMKNGDLYQYQLVMNVPIPTFIQNKDSIDAGGNGVTINPNHKIDITGLKIFDNSITWLANLEAVASETGTLVSTVTGKSVSLDDVAASMTTAAVETYTGHEFFDIIRAATDPDNANYDFDDLTSSDKLTFEINGLKLPALAAGTAPVDAEGRYILAEFTAADVSSGAKFTAYQKGDTAGDYTASAERTITSHHDASYGKSTAASADGFDKVLTDGSEFVALADGWYLNSREANDAIGAEDALGALRVSRDTANDPANNTYSQAEIIAADFNLNGEVSAADAYDILQFAVSGPDAVTGTAKWVYIDNIASNGATPSSVDFDHVIDKFVGDVVDIDATAVLIGDVTSSYSGPKPGSYQSNTFDLGNYIADLAKFGIPDMVQGETAPISNTDYVFTATASDDLIYLGADTGIHVITNFDETNDAVVISDDVHYFEDAAYYGSSVRLEYASDVTANDVANAADAVLGVQDVTIAAAGGGTTTVKANAVEVWWKASDDTDYNSVLVLDMKNVGTFSAADDLMIWTKGGDVDWLVADPLDQQSFNYGDWVT